LTSSALTYLTAKTTYPFIVFPDVNTLKLDGMQLIKQIDENEDVRLKNTFHFFLLQALMKKLYMTLTQNLFKDFSLSPQVFMI
jgi:hypothetical protein